MELGDASGDPGFDCAHGDIEDFGDVLVGTILKIKQGDGCLIDLVHLMQGLHDTGGVQLVHPSRRNGGELEIDLAQLEMGETCMTPAALEELPMESRKQPRFHLVCIAQLMAFCCPDVKRLLRQVASIRFDLCEAESELIERSVITPHKAFEIQAHRFIRTTASRSHEAANCSRIIVENVRKFKFEG